MKLTKTQLRLLAGMSVLNAALLGIPDAAEARFSGCPGSQTGFCKCVYPQGGGNGLCVESTQEVNTCFSDAACEA
jgi:hypothetical protein